MSNVKLRDMSACGISAWMKLSREYDEYIRELAGSLREWYDGSDSSDAFGEYMRRKIKQNEAFMAVDDSGECLGAVAVSKGNNRITFFGVSLSADFPSVSRTLIECALDRLDSARQISVNIPRHSAEIFVKEREAFSEYGFAPQGMLKENGVPADMYCRK